MEKENRDTFYKISVFIGSIFMIYYIFLKLAFGYTSFSIVFFIAGLILFSYGVMELKYKIHLWGRIPKKLRKVITIFIIIAVSIFLVIESIVVFNGFKKDNIKPDYVIVLGAGVKGTTISASLEERLITAIKFNKEYPDVPLVLSGGQGKGEDISEALAMKNYLINNGIDENLIIMEDKSTNTYENFLYTNEILKDITGKENLNVTVISNGFHMYRAKYLGEKVGFNCYGYPAKTRKATAVVFYVREVFAVIKAYLLNR